MPSADAQRRYEAAVKRWCMHHAGTPSSAIGTVSFFITSVACGLCGEEHLSVHARFSCRNGAGRVRMYDRVLPANSWEEFITELFEEEDNGQRRAATQGHGPDRA